MDSPSRLVQLGYTLLAEYSNSNIKCNLQDTDGYKYFCSAKHIFAGHSPAKFGRSNPFTIHNIRLWLVLNDKPFVLVTDNYAGAHNHLIFHCLKCDKDFEASWNHIHNGNGCRHCKYEVHRDVLRSIATKHGVLFEEYPFLEKEWDYEKNRVDPNLLSSRCDYRAWWKCSKCGNEWDTFVYHRTRDRSGCPKCSHSKGENEIARYLDSKNVEYKTQHWFSDCRNIRPLPFDFYLSKYNACIEFQGMQHYAPIDFKNRTVSDDECIIERYEELKKRDQIKRDYCTKNKIALLEISYKDINRIPEILSVFLGS